jgi:hypothetical protein
MNAEVQPVSEGHSIQDLCQQDYTFHYVKNKLILIERYTSISRK